MFRIAILDDDKTALMISSSAVEAFFKDKNVDFVLNSFSNPLIYIATAKEEPYDLVFLDIDMPELNGLETAKKTLEINKNAHIIFLSQREDLVFDCLTFHPFGFIRKSKLIEDFNNMMNQFYNTVLNEDSDQGKIQFIDKNKTLSFKIREIVYIVSDRNYQNVVTCDKKEELVRIPLSTLEEKLKDHGFIRIHKCYLLNHLYIRSIAGDEVKLTDGTSLPLSKKRKDEIMKQYLLFSRKNKSVII